MVRSRFDAQLEKLNIEMITMGALCEDAISAAISSLKEYDPKKVEKVNELDASIDQKEKDIESICLKLILHQQPVARDLRVVSSALKMISDMERIGDQASDIAEIAKFVQNSDIKDRTNIDKMAAASTKMVTEAIDSFVKKDLSVAKKVIESDDIVEDYFNEIKTELVDLISKGEMNAEFCLDLLMIAKYLERIGDHAVNIAEWVEYSITGVHINSELL